VRGTFCSFLRQKKLPFAPDPIDQKVNGEEVSFCRLFACVNNWGAKTFLPLAGFNRGFFLQLIQMIRKLLAKKFHFAGYLPV
jgi:hypothetical protein